MEKDMLVFLVTNAREIEKKNLNKILHVTIKQGNMWIQNIGENYWLIDKQYSCHVDISQNVILKQEC